MSLRPPTFRLVLGTLRSKRALPARRRLSSEPRPRRGAVLLLVGAVALGAAPLAARTFVVAPGRGPGLAATLAAAADGDRIEVRGGVWPGPVVVRSSLELVGVGEPVIDGGERGTVVSLEAPGIRFSGFLVRASGSSLDEENSAIAVEAPRIEVSGNRLEDVLFGIYLRKASGSVLRANRITSKDLPLPRRGDPIRVWYSDHVMIEGNRVARGRDVVLWYSSDLTVRGNDVEDGRYGLHFMYCDDADIEENRLIGNSVGSFLMYSRRLRLRRNLFAGNRGPSGYGVGLKDMDDPLLAANLLLDNRVGLYVDNSPREVDSRARYAGNVFAWNDTGVEMQPSLRRNGFAGNAFLDNAVQVGLTGGGDLLANDWSADGRGNFWSDYAGYDADGDGVGDVPYRAERLFERLTDAHPELRILFMSPASQALDFAARAFPVVRPQPKLVDERPAMELRVPAGVPTLPPAPRWPFALASLGLLALPLGLAAGARAAGRRTGTGAGAEPAMAPPPDAGTAPALSTEEPMIEVAGLTKRFGRRAAVDDLAFTVARGEAVALWGTNGAGKTTALRLVLGLLPADAGRATVGGIAAGVDAKAARRAIGFVPQELAFHDELTVGETMRFFARLKRAPAASAGPLLARLGLGDDGETLVRALSGGMKRRLALALALLGDPPLLVLDEPTANLDARGRSDFLDLLADLGAAGKTLLFTSHREEDVERLADRVIVLEAGRMVAVGAPAELADRLGRPVTLRIRLPQEELDGACRLLAERGFASRRNGHAIYLSLPARDKAEPIGALFAAGYRVEDFELERTEES